LVRHKGSDLDKGLQVVEIGLQFSDDLRPSFTIAGKDDEAFFKGPVQIRQPQFTIAIFLEGKYAIENHFIRIVAVDATFFRYAGCKRQIHLKNALPDRELGIPLKFHV
jgi:hypothetical protein